MDDSSKSLFNFSLSGPFFILITKIARTHKCDRIAVISGVGVREYYRKTT